MNYQNNEADVIQRLRVIEEKIQDQHNDTSELRDVVDELKKIVVSLDKASAIQEEKQSHLTFRIEQLKTEIELLEAKGVKSSDKQRALVENAIMAFLGGLITYIFSLISGK